VPQLQREQGVAAFFVRTWVIGLLRAS
jgi:hypothetical protein